MIILPIMHYQLSVIYLIYNYKSTSCTNTITYASCSSHLNFSFILYLSIVKPIQQFQSPYDIIIGKTTGLLRFYVIGHRIFSVIRKMEKKLNQQGWRDLVDAVWSLHQQPLAGFTFLFVPSFFGDIFGRSKVIEKLRQNFYEFYVGLIRKSSTLLYTNLFRRIFDQF